MPRPIWLRRTRAVLGLSPPARERLERLAAEVGGSPGAIADALIRAHDELGAEAAVRRVFAEDAVAAHAWGRGGRS